MTELIVSPLKRYHSDEGWIFNIKQLEDNVIVLQAHVTHLAFALHDFGVKKESSAPSNILNAINAFLNEKYGQKEWRIVTLLLPIHFQEKDVKELVFDQTAKMLWYSKKSGKVSYNEVEKDFK